MAKIVNPQLVEKLLKSIIGTDRKIVLLNTNTPKDATPDTIVAKDLGSRYAFYQPTETLNQITDIVPYKMKLIEFANVTDTTPDTDQMVFGEHRFKVFKSNAELVEFYKELQKIRKELAADNPRGYRRYDADDLRVYYYKVIYDKELNRRDSYFVSTTQQYGREGALDTKMSLAASTITFDGPGAMGIQQPRIVVDAKAKTPAVKFNPGGCPIIKSIVIKYSDEYVQDSMDPTTTGTEIKRLDNIYDYMVTDAYSDNIPITMPEDKNFIYVFMHMIDLEDNPAPMMFTSDRGEVVKVQAVLLTTQEITEVMNKCKDEQEYANSEFRGRIYSHYSRYDYTLDKWTKMMDVYKAAYKLDQATIIGYQHNIFQEIVTNTSLIMGAMNTYSSSTPNITDIWKLQEYKDALDFVEKSTSISYFSYQYGSGSSPINIDLDNVNKLRNNMEHVIPHVYALNFDELDKQVEQDPADTESLKELYKKIKATSNWIANDHGEFNQSAFVRTFKDNMGKIDGYLTTIKQKVPDVDND